MEWPGPLPGKGIQDQRGLAGVRATAGLHLAAFTAGHHPAEAGHLL